MAAQFTQVSLGTLRRDLAVSRRIQASAVRQNDATRAEAENRRVRWLELHIAYLEELSERYAGR